MKEELQGKMVEILTAIQTATGKAGEFAMTQLPDIAQTYVTYGRVASVVWVLMGVLLIALGVLALVIAKSEDTGNWDESFFQFLKGGYWIAFFTTVAGVLQFGYAMNSALLVWFAPKVWLLRELAGFLK